MRYVLGIETSCDETGAAVFDMQQHRLISHGLFSQIEQHKQYGGVVPEIASRSQLEKITPIIQKTLDDAKISIDDIDVVAVTNKPGLVGSLLVGVCFAKGLCWQMEKKIVGIDHIEAHIFSSFLLPDGSINQELKFPFLCLSASGGHTAFHIVHDFGVFELVGQTLDDAAGEAFDKVAKLLGLGYPGGARIEKLATSINFVDTIKYPRLKSELLKKLSLSFSGLKTAVLYDLANRGAYNLSTGPILSEMTPDLQARVSSSLLVCVGDLFAKAIGHALEHYPNLNAVAFVGGVACNKYLRNRINDVCIKRHKKFVPAPPAFCSDNGAMVAFVGSYKAQKCQFSDLYLDVMK